LCLFVSSSWNQRQRLDVLALLKQRRLETDFMLDTERRTVTESLLPKMVRVGAQRQHLTNRATNQL